MTTYLPIILSVLSLIIAGTGLFFQHLYYVDEVVCLLTNFSGSSDHEGKLSVFCQISVSNAGTRAMMLEHAQMQPRIYDKDRGCCMSYHGNRANSPSVPAMLPKGEFVPVMLTQSIPPSVLSDFLKHRIDPTKPLEFYVRLTFLTVTGERMEFDRCVGTFEPTHYGYTITRFDTVPVKIGGKRIRLDWNVV